MTRWLDSWFDFRDRLLSSVRFQEWAARFPPTRFIARRRASDLFDLCAGFVYSQVLLACVELELFDILLDEPRTARQLAPQLGLTEAALTRLLDAAVSLRLLERRSDQRYGLGQLGAVMARNPALAAMVRHHRHLYVDLVDPLPLLRGEVTSTKLSKYWAYADATNPSALNDGDVASYSSLMALSQPLVAEEVLGAVRLEPKSSLLDVGGGEGAFLAAVAARSPDLKLTLLDLPAVTTRAKVRLAQQGISHRIELVGANFLTDPIPKGHDVITLVRVILDHDDNSVITLLKSIHKSLKPNGILIIAEPMADTPGAEVMGSAYFGLYMMAMGRGRARTRKQISDLLVRAGFDSTRFYAGERVLRTGIAVARR
jgi:demethylspheroidene O-methyltransferase